MNERDEMWEAKVKRYRERIRQAFDGDREVEALRLMMRAARVADLDIEERHMEMDAILLAMVPEAVASVFLETRRRYA